MGIYKKAKNITIIVKDTYNLIGGASYEEAERVTIRAKEINLTAQKRVIMQGIEQGVKFEKFEGQVENNYSDSSSIPKIVKGFWSKTSNGEQKITEAALEDTVYFIIETFGIEDGEQLKVQLYDYDHFLWYGFLNFDEKIDRSRQVKVKNNRAVIEVYLKPDWKKHIDEDLGLLKTIELYWEVSCEKARPKTEILPAKNGDYLKVRNDRDIYIKPVMSETGYSYGVPEMYSFEGEPMFFVEIGKTGVLSEKNSTEKMVDEVTGFIESTIVSSAVTLAEEGSKKALKKLALAKLEKGYLVTNNGNIIRKPNSVREYTEYIGEELVTYYRASHTGTFRQGETTRGVSQLPAMQKHMKGASMLYFIKNSAEIFGNFSSLVDLAKGGKDVNAVAADALALAATSSPFIGLLLSTFGKLTLDVLASPMKKFMEEGLERDKKELDVMKFRGKKEFEQQLFNYIFLRDIYKTRPIGYKTMQSLLDGTIKRQTDLESAHNEVIIFYKEIEESILIDTFFINTEKE